MNDRNLSIFISMSIIMLYLTLLREPFHLRTKERGGGGGELPP